MLYANFFYTVKTIDLTDLGLEDSTISIHTNHSNLQTFLEFRFMFKFTLLRQIVFYLFLCIFSLSIFSQEVLAQSVRIEAQSSHIIEGETGLFNVYVTLPSSDDQEEEDNENDETNVNITIKYSGDFFTVPPGTETHIHTFDPNENPFPIEVPTKRDNQYEPDGSVQACVGTNATIASICLIQDKIYVLDEVRESEESIISLTNKKIISEVTKVTNSSSFNAISDRMDQNLNLATSETNLQNFQEIFSKISTANETEPGQKSQNWETLKGDFDIKFAAAHGNNLPPSFYVWGKSEYQQISGTDDNENVNWDGRVIGGHIGFDTKLSSNITGGLLTTFSTHNLDFRANYQQYEGQSTQRMVSLFPYLGWSTQSRSFNIWTSAGLGIGKVDLDVIYRKKLCIDWKARQTDKEKECPHLLYTDTIFHAAALGTKARVFSSNFFNGETELNIKSGITGSRYTLDNDSTIEEEINIREVEINNFQANMVVENSTKFPLSSNYNLNPKFSLSGRWDGGHGTKGYGINAGVNLGLQANWGAIEGFGKYLIIHNNNSINEWGAGGQIKFDSGLDRLGAIFNLSLNSKIDPTTSNSRMEIWDQQFLNQNLSKPNNNSDHFQLSGEIGYGFTLRDELSVFTPFAAADFSANNYSSISYGGKFSFATNVDLEAKTTRQQNSDNEISQLYSITGTVRW